MPQKNRQSLILLKSNIVQVSLLAFSYLLFAQLQVHFADTHPFLNYLWVPSGLALAMLLLCGVRVSVGVLVGVVLAAISMPHWLEC